MSQKRVLLTTISPSNVPLGPPAPIASTSSGVEARRASFSEPSRRPSVSSINDGRHANGHLAKMTLDKGSTDRLNDRLSDGGGGASGANSSKKGGEKKEESPIEAKTFRFTLKLNQPTSESFAEYYFDELIKNRKKKKSKLSNNADGAGDGGLGIAGKDPFGDEDNDDDVRRLAQKMEERYGNAYGGGSKKKRRSAWEDYVDKGQGYDETDPFIDNDEAYDELIPSSLTTKHGGFYVNMGTLEFKPVSISDEEGAADDDEDDDMNGTASDGGLNPDGTERIKKVPKKKKVQREYPAVVRHKVKDKGNKKSGSNADGANNNNSSFIKSELRKKEKKNFSSLKRKAIEQRKALAERIKLRMEASAGSPSTPTGSASTPNTPTSGLAPPLPGQQVPVPGSSSGTSPNRPIVVDLENEEEEELLIKRKKTAVINDDDEDGVGDHKNGGQTEEDAPCRQSVIDVIESVARGPSKNQLEVDKMTADQMAAQNSSSACKSESKMTIHEKDVLRDNQKLMVKPANPTKHRPTSLPMASNSGHSQRVPTPMSTSEGLMSSLMSNLHNNPQKPSSPSVQLAALSASLLGPSAPTTTLTSSSGHGHHHGHHQQQLSRTSPSPSIPQPGVQRSKTPPAATSLLNPKAVSNLMNSRVKIESSMTSMPTPVKQRSSSLMHSANNNLQKAGHTDVTVSGSSLIDQVITSGLRGYGQSSSPSLGHDLKQPSPAHQQSKSGYNQGIKSGSSSQGHGQHHAMDNAHLMSRTLSQGSVGTKHTASPAQNIMDALINQSLNSSLRTSQASDAEPTHTKLVKYKDHHRVPSLSRTPPLGTGSKVPSPPTTNILGGTSLLSSSGQAMSAGGKITTPSMAAGIHRSAPGSGHLQSSSSGNKPKPGPLSKRSMSNNQTSPISSTAAMFGIPSAPQQSKPQVDMSGAPYGDLYSKLMMTMGQYGQQQPNVPITINPILSGGPSPAHSSSSSVGTSHRTINHSIDALVSPTVPSSSSSVIMKPSVKMTSNVQQQQLPPNSLFTTFMNQQQQYKK